MMIEKTLKQFWRCVDMEYTGDDKDVCEAFNFKEKLTNKNIIISGLYLQYDIDEPLIPSFLSFEMWDLRADELNPGFWSTGHLIELQPIKNGFKAITGDLVGKTIYTFKKTKISPIERFLKRNGQYCNTSVR